jgi:hypothetical protein
MVLACPAPSQQTAAPQTQTAPVETEVTPTVVYEVHATPDGTQCGQVGQDGVYLGTPLAANRERNQAQRQGQICCSAGGARHIGWKGYQPDPTQPVAFTFPLCALPAR